MENQFSSSINSHVRINGVTIFQFASRSLKTNRVMKRNSLRLVFTRYAY